MLAPQRIQTAVYFVLCVSPGPTTETGTHRVLWKWVTRPGGAGAEWQESDTGGQGQAPSGLEHNVEELGVLFRRKEPHGYVSRGGLWEDLLGPVCGLKDVLRPPHPVLRLPWPTPLAQAPPTGHIPGS